MKWWPGVLIVDFTQDRGQHRFFIRHTIQRLLRTEPNVPHRQLSLGSVKGDRLPPGFELPLQCDFWGDRTVFRQRRRRLSSFASRSLTIHTSAVTELVEHLVMLH